MSTSPKPKPQASWTVMLTVGILAAVAAVFVIAFSLSSQPLPPETPVDDTKYVAEVTALLANADAARGEELVTTKYECGACHIQGAGKTAPGFEGLSERAATEHPPLTAEAYIYESLLHPPDHIVEGYANSMPANYGTRLTPEELGDIIAYLLTQ